MSIFIWLHYAVGEVGRRLFGVEPGPEHEIYGQYIQWRLYGKYPRLGRVPLSRDFLQDPPAILPAIANQALCGSAGETCTWTDDTSSMPFCSPEEVERMLKSPHEDRVESKSVKPPMGDVKG